jgi:flagellin-like hook-associated protein FlgL
MVQLSSADPVTEASTGGVVDYAREIVTVIEVEIGAAASLKVTATQQQLDKNALDLLA